MEVKMHTIFVDHFSTYYSISWWKYHMYVECWGIQMENFPKFQLWIQYWNYNGVLRMLQSDIMEDLRY